MEKEEIESFISSNLERGLSTEEIRQQLLRRGASDYDIDSSFQKVQGEEKDKPKEDITLDLD